MFKKNLATLIIILLVASAIVIILVSREQGELSATANISYIVFGRKETAPEQAELGSKTAGQLGEQIKSE